MEHKHTYLKTNIEDIYYCPKCKNTFERNRKTSKGTKISIAIMSIIISVILVIISKNIWALSLSILIFVLVEMAFSKSVYEIIREV